MERLVGTSADDQSGILRNYPDTSLEIDLLKLFTYQINNYPTKMADHKKFLIKARDFLPFIFWLQEVVHLSF